MITTSSSNCIQRPLLRYSPKHARCNALPRPSTRLPHFLAVSPLRTCGTARFKSSRMGSKQGRHLLSRKINTTITANTYVDEYTLPVEEGFHLHFGAGRLGMGLVVPCIAESGVPFAIMQPPFEEFDPVLKSSKSSLSVSVNGEELLADGLRVVKDSQGLEALLNGNKPSGGSMVLTEPSEEEGKWGALVKKATSFSCSVGPALPKILGPLLVDNLPKVPEDEQPILYACENDHAAVEKLRLLTVGRVKVVACMVDRICSSREVLDSGDISVTTEPFPGTIMVLTPKEELFPQGADKDGKEPTLHAPIPVAGPPVFIPRTKEIADYRYERKIYFVNHMHTTLALMTLARHRQLHQIPINDLLKCEGEEVDWEGVVSGDIQRACVPLTLANPKEVNEVMKLELKCWMVAQVLLLMQKFPLEVIMEGEHRQTDTAGLVKSLVDVATSRMMRFASVVDTCDRVLGAGVACRFEGRLLPAYHEVTKMKAASEHWTDETIEKQILDQAGLTIHDVFWSLKRMVSEGGEIAEADLIRRHGSSPEDREQARLGWIVTGMHRMQLDWLCCAMGLATEDQLYTIDNPSTDEGEVKVVKKVLVGGPKDKIKGGKLWG